jgi:epoxyqueuosine reductase
MDAGALKRALVQKAEDEGFSLVRITAPDKIPQAAERLAAFVDSQYHGQMNWMEERMHWRGNPAALWSEAKSVVMLAELYTPKHDPMAVIKEHDRGAISVYAQNKDYHDALKKRLKRVGRWLIEQVQDAEIKVFVDTAPVMEKPLGMAAGLGWQGKHTNLVSRELGNWFFLGSIFTTIDFPNDEAEVDHCGSCRACLDVCPTNAFPAPYQLDARKCISYLTIEHKGPVDLDLRSKMGNRIYGCDDCLAACPWNKFAVEASEARYLARDDLIAPPLAELAKLDDTSFRQKFSGSPIKRIGVDRFIRNVLYAIGNSGDMSLRDAAAAHLQSHDEAVRDAAVWALETLDD